MPPRRRTASLGDPTTNVLSLVKAANRRQDDLRHAEMRLRSSLFELERRHAAELREMESKHRDAQEAAESRRLDAIIAVQTAAATRDATHIEATAAATRITVEATAKAFQGSLDTIVKQITDRLTPLEQARYEQGGRREQWAENRSRGQWTFQQAVTLLGMLLVGLYFVLNYTKP